MPASILPQNQDEKELFNAISSFFSRFKIGNLLRACNAQKEKGVPVTRIFKYKLCIAVSGEEDDLQEIFCYEYEEKTTWQSQNG